MKLRLALAFFALASPAFAQSLPTPNFGTGTKLNGANLTTTATKGQGTSVADPGTGNLEALLPVQTVTGASKTFAAADLYKETRRSNSGSAMTDTFPGSATTGLANGTTIQLNNVDTTASITLSAGSGTTLNGNASVTIPPSRSTKWVYDAPSTVWRSTMNSLSGVNGPSSATSGNIATFNGSTGSVIQDSGKTPPAGAIVGTNDIQTLTNKIINGANNTITVRLGSDVSGQTPTANGGTGQATAAAARGSSGLNVESGTGHGDSAYTILATDRWVFTNTAFTASRTWTLPAASAVNPGAPLYVDDAQGTVTATNTLVVSRAGSDTINGGTSFTIDVANGRLILFSDGVSKWTARLQRPYGTAAGNAVNLDSAAKLPAVDGSALTALNAGNLGSGTVPAGRMPALTGSCTTTVGTVATTCEQDGAWTAYTPTPTYSGTAPTSASTAASKWKQIGSKTYVVLISFVVSTLGPGAGNVTIPLPNSTTSTGFFGCLGVNANTTAMFTALTSGSNALFILGTMAQNTYTAMCTYEAT